MKIQLQTALLCAGLAFAAVIAPRAAEAAIVIPYPTPSIENPVLIPTYTVGVTGFVTATVALPNGAGLTNELGYSLNGGATLFTGLDSKAAVGESTSFGVTSGDIVRLFIRTSFGDTWSSDVSLNSDGVNHVYSVAYTGSPDLGALVPLGRYVSFEDLPGRTNTDLNYNDFNLVLTNISAGVPEPATWAMMLIGFAGLAVAGSRRQRAMAAAV